MTATMTSVADRAPALAAPIACAGCLAVGAAYVAANDPSDGGVFLPCPFRALTGWWCPGCGITRAVHHLFRGDMVQALRYNVFVVLVLIGVATAWAAWTLNTMGRSLLRGRTIPNQASWGAVAALIAYAVIRNASNLPLTG